MGLVQAYDREKMRLRSGMLAVAIMSVFTNLCLLGIPFYLFETYNRVIPSRNLVTLVAISLVAALLLLTYGILDAVRQGWLLRIGSRYEASVTGLLLGAELSDTKRQPGQGHHLLSSIRKTISSNVFPNLFDLPIMVGFIFIIFIIHPVLGAIVSFGMVFLISVAFLGEMATKGYSAASEERHKVARSRMHGALLQRELIKSLGLYPQIVAQWGQDYGAHLKELIAMQTRSGSLASLSKVIRQLIQIAIIGGGAYLVIVDHLNAGIIFATSIVASRALAPIESIVAGWAQLKQARLCQTALDKLIGTIELGDRQTLLPRPSKELIADRVIYAPAPGAQPILKGITGRIPVGQVAAIIGPSGAGKSTFARILAGALEPTSGQVLLDGQNFKAWDPVTRGIYMGYMPQQVGFFEGTVRENIARMRCDDPPAYAIEIAQFLGIHEMIMRFPQGYDTVISETGFQPSGGQKQLLGLARAYYGMPTFVILDEPNANLDGEGEQLLFRILAKTKAAGIATIVVTQRLSLLRYVDNVLELKNGQVEAYGPPDKVPAGKNVSAIGAKIGKQAL